MGTAITSMLSAPRPSRILQPFEDGDSNSSWLILSSESNFEDHIIEDQIAAVGLCYEFGKRIC